MASSTPRTRPQQLALEWTAPMRWADLPATVQAQLRAELAALLQQTAMCCPAVKEERDEHA
jgi:hypothetical protein